VVVAVVVAVVVVVVVGVFLNETEKQHVSCVIGMLTRPVLDSLLQIDNGCNTRKLRDT
jgi:hypothetical protein